MLFMQGEYFVTGIEVVEQNVRFIEHERTLDWNAGGPDLNGPAAIAR